MARSQFNFYRSGTGHGSSKSPFNEKPAVSKRSWRSRSFDWILLFSVLACLIYSLLVSGPAKITGNSWPYRSKAIYEQAANRYLSGFKDKTKLSFDETGISSGMTRQFPEIADVAVELPLVSEQPVVHLAISPPEFVLSSNSQTYILDDQGVIVGQASSFPALKNLPTLSDQSGFGVKVGQQILSSTNVSFINQVLSQSKRAGIVIASATLPAKGQELDIKTKDQVYIVKFYLGGDAAQQIGQFLAARHQFANSQDTPKVYLDVRINGKIYYQ